MFGRRKKRSRQQEIEFYANQYRQRAVLQGDLAEGSDMPEDWREESAGEREDGVEIPEVPEPKKRKRRGIRIGQFFTGGILSQDEFTKRLPVIVYIVFLMLLYIANGFHLQRKHSRLDRLNDEIKHLKTIAVTTSAVRMTATRQSEIERLLEDKKIPLTVGDTPPRIIEQPKR